MNTSTFKRGIVSLLISGVAYLGLNIWKPYSVLNIVLATILFILLMAKAWNKAIYFIIASLSYNYISVFLGYGVLLTIAAAVLWPITATLGIVSLVAEEGDTIITPMEEEIIEPIPVEEIKPIENETPVKLVPTEVAPTSTEPEQQEGSESDTRIQVRTDSSVRSGPSTEFPMVFLANQGETYVVLESNAEKTWYKIESAEGLIGWIGSTRVTETSP